MARAAASLALGKISAIVVRRPEDAACRVGLGRHSTARILTLMPTLPAIRRRASPRPRVCVLGDLLLDVVVIPEREPMPGTDVPGRVVLRQGGSAATTARWLARLGARVALVTAVGRDAPGRALVDEVRRDGVSVRAVRPAGHRTGRIAVVVDAAGERSFVADRSAADALQPDDLRSAWFGRIELLHLPIYSLLGEPIGSAGRRAVELARGVNALVSVDLASSLPLLGDGQRAGWDRLSRVAPDLLFATLAEAHALLGGGSIERLLELAPIAVVKRGPKGATVLARARSSAGGRLRFEAATRPIDAPDTTGAGDAFDAGFLVSWLRSRADRAAVPVALQRAALAGHRAAARQLTASRPELNFG
jgi:ribokinase